MSPVLGLLVLVAGPLADAGEPPSPSRDAPVAVAEPPLGEWTTPLVQFAVPFAAHAVITLQGFVLEPLDLPDPGSTYLGAVWLAAFPVVSGLWTVLVGDLFGPARGTTFWPVLAGVAGTLSSAVLVAVYASAIYGLVAAQNPGLSGAELESRWDTHPLLLGGGYVLYTLNAVLTAGLPVLAYALTAEPKEPGDDGARGVPGFFTPRHPSAAPTMSDRERAAD